MTKYYYNLYCEGGWLHKSELFDSYSEAEEEALTDIEEEASLEESRNKDDYYYEIEVVEDYEEE